MYGTEVEVIRVNLRLQGRIRLRRFGLFFALLIPWNLPL